MQNPDPQRRLRLHSPARRRILREVLEQFWQIAQSMPEGIAISSAFGRQKRTSGFVLGRPTGQTVSKQLVIHS
jgi:hypothetical protein